MDNTGVTERRQSSTRGRGRPRRLEPEQLVEVARRILKEEGVEALSMRRVAKEVGATPMALYHHVRDKDELLMLALSGMAATVPRPALPDEPRARLLAVSLHMHAVLRQMPWVVEVLSLGGLTDEGALWMVEEIVDSAIACGLPTEAAVHAYRTIWHCVYGDLVFRHATEKRAGEPDRTRHFPDALLGEADAAELPRLAVLADRWSAIDGAYDIAEQLDSVITGLLARGTRSASGAPGA